MGFLQISPRVLGSSALLSPFLIGTTVVDPVTGVRQSFNDLDRRRLDLESIVCPGTSALACASLQKGIQRVH